MAIPKVMGVETEYGITVKNPPDFNPILSSLLLINSYGPTETSPVPPKGPSGRSVPYLLPFFGRRKVYPGGGKGGAENTPEFWESQMPQRPDSREPGGGREPMPTPPIITPRDEPHAD